MRILTVPWFTPLLAAVAVAGCQCDSVKPCTEPGRADGLNIEVCIPGGAFVMGADPIEVGPNPYVYWADGGICAAEDVATKCYQTKWAGPRNDWAPRHEVVLSPFFISKFETTIGEYRACVEAGACKPPAGSAEVSEQFANAANNDRPVTSVTWDDANNYCKWKGGRLPTEAEWERAARGPKSFDYPWGNDSISNITQPTFPYGPVGSIERDTSPDGVRDMFVLPGEWVSDWYDATYYERSSSLNPSGPEQATTGSVKCCESNGNRTSFAWDSERVVKGSFENFAGREWENSGKATPSWLRGHETPTFRESFRCVRDDPSTPKETRAQTHSALTWTSYPEEQR